MASAQANIRLSRPSFANDGAVSRPSVTTPHALALTSKQRVISVDMLQTITRILRSVGPRVEAAALQEAMQDPRASEFVAAAMAQAEASTSNESTITGNVSSASFFHTDGSVKRPSTASQLSTTDEAPAPVKLAALLRASNAASATETPSTQENTGATDSIWTGVSGTKPQQVSSVHATWSCDTAVPGSTRSPRSRVACAHSADGVARTQGQRHATQTEQHAGEAYRFPSDWFTVTAIERLTRAHHATSSPPAADSRGYCMEASSQSNLPVDGHDDVGAPPPRTTLSTSIGSYSSLPASTDASLEAPAAPPRDAAANTHCNSLARFPSSSPPQTPCTSGYVASDDRITATTAQPPLFVDNTLLDPASGRFLFGGHAFREEARVLYVPPMASARPESMTSRGSEAFSPAAAARRRVLGGASATVRPTVGTQGSETSATLMLVREYFPLFTISTPDGGGGGERVPISVDANAATPPDDIFVQSFSLLPPWLTQVPPNRYHLLSEAVAIACVCQALPGCVTVVTPFSHLLRCGRCVSLAAATPRGSQRGFTLPLRSPSVNAEGAGSQPASHKGAQLTCRGSGFAARKSPPTSVRASNSSFPIPNDDQEVEVARIAAVAERVSAIPPDTLNASLAAVLYCLTFFGASVERRQRIREVFAAVRVLQRFFRRCLAVKRRALRRMTRIWCKLEVEARLKLQQHRALPTAVERVDAVANMILQEHMLTSLDYKRKLIQDEWARRRAAFAKWKEEEEWNDLFAEEQQAQIERNMKEKNEKTDKGKGEEAVAQTPPSSLPQQSSSQSSLSRVVRPRSARLTAEEEQHMADAFEKRHGQPSSKGPTASSTPAVTSSSLVAAGVSAVQGAALSPSLAEAEALAQRYEAARRRFCSWYIDPHELLYLSHQRLLETLKGSVLSMEKVQSELNRAAAEMARDAAGGTPHNT